MLKLKYQYIEIAFLFWFGGGDRLPFSIAIYYLFSPIFVKQQFTVSSTKMSIRYNIHSFRRLSDFDDFGGRLVILSQTGEVVPAEWKFKEKGFVCLGFRPKTSK